MNLGLELSLGTLLEIFRSRRGLKGRDVASSMTNLLSQISLQPRSLYASGLSNIESNNSGRPDMEMLQAFSQIYQISAFEYTNLLRQADYYPDVETIEALRGRLASSQRNSACPKCILTYRSTIVTWNPAFAQLLTNDPSSVDLHSGGLSSSLPPISATQSGPRTPDLGIPTREHAQSWQLLPGASLFELVFHPMSPLRKVLSQNDWELLSVFLLTRFWRTIEPLIQPAWNKSLYAGETGIPDWLSQRLDQLARLPEPGGAEFSSMSQAIRNTLLRDSRDPAVQLAQGIHIDQLTCTIQQRPYCLTPHELTDARFWELQFCPD